MTNYEEHEIITFADNILKNILRRRYRLFNFYVKPGHYLAGSGENSVRKERKKSAATFWMEKMI